MKIDWKPWGHEEIMIDPTIYPDAPYIMKRLVIKAGELLSEQYHKQKDEAYYVESGTCEIILKKPSTNESKTAILTPDSTVHILPGTIHRLRAITETRVLEVSTPHLGDIVRISDKYGRVPLIALKEKADTVQPA